MFAKTEVVFLSHIISADSYRPTPEKVRAILDYPQPQTMEELRWFIGFINFYRSFIKHAAKKQAPLHALLYETRKKDKRPVLWTKETELAVKNCKNSLADAALLAYPDENGTIRIHSIQ